MIETPADDRTDESADMVAETPAGDPADLAGTTADADADKMHGESDEIAAKADANAPGHGPTG